MDTALGLGMDLAQQAIIDAEMQRRSGLYMREYIQGSYELSHKIFLEQEEISVMSLEVFGNALRAITGSQQTTSSDDQSISPLMAIVGITSATIGLYNAIAPAGTAAGVGGWIASLFGGGGGASGTIAGGTEIEAAATAALAAS
jgi:hypothetical protein